MLIVFDSHLFFSQTETSTSTQPSINPCLSRPCLNSGTCLSATEPGRNAYICLCDANYSGLNCEISKQTESSKKLHLESQ